MRSLGAATAAIEAGLTWPLASGHRRPAAGRRRAAGCRWHRSAAGQPAPRRQTRRPPSVAGAAPPGPALRSDDSQSQTTADVDVPQPAPRDSAASPRRGPAAAARRPALPLPALRRRRAAAGRHHDAAAECPSPLQRRCHRRPIARSQAPRQRSPPSADRPRCSRHRGQRGSGTRAGCPQ